jgi:hypothetical protein
VSKLEFDSKGNIQTEYFDLYNNEDVIIVTPNQSGRFDLDKNDALALAELLLKWASPYSLRFQKLLRKDSAIRCVLFIMIVLLL